MSGDFFDEGYERQDPRYLAREISAIRAQEEQRARRDELAVRALEDESKYRGLGVFSLLQYMDSASLPELASNKAVCSTLKRLCANRSNTRSCEQSTLLCC